MTDKDHGPGGVGVIFPEDLDAFIAKRREGTYVLLDVRQPEEYKEYHLPGSLSIPLPLLPDSLAQLNPETETIVYCALGGRSMSAASFLAARGFQSVFQLQGGIEAWEGGTAAGPADFHLYFIHGGETAMDAARIAYGMERGLERFHKTAADVSGNPRVKSLLEKLIQAEQSHVRKLEALIESLGSEPGEADGADGRMEGGMEIDLFLHRNAHRLDSPEGCLELAMMIEIQALDLYLQMARGSSDPAAREVFNGLGDEEKAHLRALGELLGSEAKANKVSS